MHGAAGDDGGTGVRICVGVTVTSVHKHKQTLTPVCTEKNICLLRYLITHIVSCVYMD